MIVAATCTRRNTLLARTGLAIAVEPVVAEASLSHRGRRGIRLASDFVAAQADVRDLRAGAVTGIAAHFPVRYGTRDGIVAAGARCAALSRGGERGDALTGPGYRPLQAGPIDGAELCCYGLAAVSFIVWPVLRSAAVSDVRAPGAGSSGWEVCSEHVHLLRQCPAAAGGRCTDTAYQRRHGEPPRRDAHDRRRPHVRATLRHAL